MQPIPPLLLELRNVDAVFDGIIQVLRSVNLEVRTGKITALLGGNGAGKTTTLKAISGLLAVEHGKVSEGQIRFEGEDITNEDPVKVFRKGIVQVLEGRKVLAHLSVEQNSAGRRSSPLRPAGRPGRHRARLHLLSPTARTVQTRVGIPVGRRNADAAGGTGACRTP